MERERKYELAVAALIMVGTLGTVGAVVLIAAASHIKRPEHGWINARGERAPRELVDRLAGEALASGGYGKYPLSRAQDELRKRGYDWKLVPAKPQRLQGQEGN